MEYKVKLFNETVIVKQNDEGNFIVPDKVKSYLGVKTAGLKPSHEPITIFQKPVEKNYCYNIEKYDCGGMNIDACRVEFSENDDPRIGKDYKHHAKAGLENATQKDNSNGELLSLHNNKGRFPPNIIMDEYIADEFDEQTGISKSTGGSGEKSKGALGKNLYGDYKNNNHAEHAGGLGDVGGGSRMFPIIKYQQKVSPKERLLPNHAVSCEELNKEGYNIKYINIEMMNTEAEPYCNVGKLRVESVVK